MKTILNAVKAWLPLAAAIIFFCGLVELAVQQNFRSGANDPQIQLAEDAARAWQGGEMPAALTPAGQVDIALSLAPYLVFYGPDMQPSGGNGRLHGSLPAIPVGVFEYAAREGRNLLTWQPELGVRSAVVVVPVNGGKGGYVLAGRSLREVELREDNLIKICAAGGAGGLVATLVLVFLLEILPVKPKNG